MKYDTETITQFEQRKRDHIRLALDPHNQTLHLSDLHSIHLEHEAFPEMNFDEVDLSTTFFGKKIPVPLFVSSMTAGHEQATSINQVIAEVCAKRGWPMGVGSQRRQIHDANASTEWKKIRRMVPNIIWMGNIGLTQLIETPIATIQALVDSLQAIAMIVHTNPLQECLQPEGTPRFQGGYKALEQLCKNLSVPVIVKETGCGFSAKTLKRLNETGIAVIDISGTGGTHWGRIEGQRSENNNKLMLAAETFKDWGMSTLQSLQYALSMELHYSIWASGGMRSGLDAAKLLAMGSKMIGFAKPILEAALIGTEALNALMERYEYELKMALFLTGSRNLPELQESKKWR